MEKEKIGFTIGKFAPLHKGHQYLIETALNEMDRVIVIVYDTDVIDIPTEKRAEWIKTLYPTVDVRCAHNPPEQYGLDKESVAIQMEYLSKILKNEKPTHFYSSEPYGASVANYMHIVDRRVDNTRKKNPISATELRQNPLRNQEFVSEKVRQDWVLSKTYNHEINKINSKGNSKQEK